MSVSVEVRDDVQLELTRAGNRQTPLVNPVDSYLAELADGPGRASARRCLRIAARAFGAEPEGVQWENLRFYHVSAIRERMKERGLAPNTVNLTLYALRGVARHCRLLGLMSKDDYDAILEVRRSKGTRQPKGRAASPGEIRALLQACREDPSPTGLRDAAIIAVLYGTGLRRTELARLNLGDYRSSTGELKVIGKGDRERTMYVTGSAKRMLEEWLDWRGQDAGGLFLPLNKGGRVIGEKISSQVVYRVVSERAKEAGLEELSPHDLRRTVIGDLLDDVKDLSKVSKYIGHASVETTAVYDRREERARREVADHVYLPYIPWKGGKQRGGVGA